MATQIQRRQIADGAVTTQQIAPDAGIATTQLADGANLVNRSGSVPFTGSQSFGGNRASNLATPSAASDAATKGYVDTQIANLNSIFDSKPSARAATTANINLASPGGTHDGVALNNGDVLFVRAQTNQAENGEYVFTTPTAALTRHPNMDSWSEIPGSFFAVEEGSAFGDTIWLCTANAAGTLGSTAITFQQIPTSAGMLPANFADKEIPSGALNGTNTAFTLAFTPVAGTEHVYLNGLLLESGAGNDYTISGATITLLTPPAAGEKIRVSYRK